MSSVRRILDSEGGFAMFLVLLIASVLLSLGVFSSRGARIETRIATNDLLAKKARAVAEAGANMAIRALLDNPAGYPVAATSRTGGALEALGGTVKTYDGTSYRFVAFGGGSSDGYYVRADDASNEYMKLTSRGVVGQTERVVEVMMKGPKPSQSGIGFPGFFADHSIVMSGSTSDGYNSNTHPGCNPPTGFAGGCSRCGSMGTNSATKVNGASIIDGDLTTAASTVSSGGVVYGDRVTDAPQTPLPPLGACDANGGYSSGAGLVLTGSSVYYTNTNPPPCSGCVFNPSKAGELKINDNSSITPGTYCFKTVSLAGTSTLTVTGDTTINVTGLADLTGGSIVNTTCQPSNLKINSSAVGSNMVKVAGGSGAYMSIFAPKAEVMTTGNSDFWGSIVSDILTVSGGMRLHYDQAIQEAAAALAGVPVKVHGRHEVRAQ